jgi:hypothetical protein
MRILVTEHSDHFSLLNHLDQLFEVHDEVIYAFRVTSDQAYWKSIFQTSRVSKTFSDTSRIIRELRFFGFILLFGFKAKKIIVNTGPEYESGKMAFLSMIAYLPHRRKLIYTVRNPVQFESSSTHNRFARRLKRLLITQSESLIFENTSVASRINKIFPLTATKPQAILYTYFLEREPELNSELKKNDYYAIGLLGTVSPERRDYLLVLEALENFKRRTRVSLQVVFLGSTSHEASESIIREFQAAGSQPIFINGWLSDQAFIELGTGCDILLAPLRFGVKEYGLGGSTGAFGDAIRLRKRLLIPNFSDTSGEFSSFSTYYENASSLCEALITEHRSNRGLEITPDMEFKFGKQKAVMDLKRLLRI